MNRTLVTGFLIEDGRVRGIQTEKGIFYADVIVNACGSWAGKVAGLAGLDMPIKPRKGQLAVTEPIGFYMSPTIQCARYNVIKFHPETIKDETVLRLGSSMNIAQTEEGGLLIGGTREFAGFEGENTLEAIDTMMKRVLRFFPGLKDVHVIRRYAAAGRGAGPARLLHGGGPRGRRHRPVAHYRPAHCGADCGRQMLS